MSYLKNFYNYIFHKSATLMNRNQLGSIDLLSINKSDKSENEIKERNSAIATSYKHIERTIKNLIIAQQEFMANQCENEQQLLFGRGTMNGLSLVLEKMKKYKGQHDEDLKPDENFEKHEVF